MATKYNKDTIFGCATIVAAPEDRWEVCHTCDCVFKLLNTPDQQRRGY